MLIVNADDWGAFDGATRTIADCYRAGGITSTTAMVFMRASKFGASLVRENPDLKVGLHLNLNTEYTSPSTPVSIRKRQRRLIERIKRRRLRSWLFDPLVRRDVDSIVRDQLQAFFDLYGHPPTHIDGHRHCHMAANVVFSAAIPSGTKIRNIADTAPGAKRAVLQRLWKAVVSRRLPTTDYFFSLSDIWSDADGLALEKLELAHHNSVEIMVHPHFPIDREILSSEAWIAALQGFTTGGFDAL